MAKSLGVDQCVRWIGAVGRDEAPACFQNCHAFVLPSRSESFAVVCAEAIACGRPVIATAAAARKYSIHDGNGILISPEDAGQIAAALAKMKEITRDLIRRPSGAISSDAFRARSLRRDWRDVWRSLGQELTMRPSNCCFSLMRSRPAAPLGRCDAGTWPNMARRGWEVEVVTINPGCLAEPETGLKMSRPAKRKKSGCASRPAPGASLGGWLKLKLWQPRSWPASPGA